MGRGVRKESKEPLCEWISSFVAFFIYLLILKSFFLPLFIIPTGSMAETLYGNHSAHTCPNCGVEYPVGLPVRVPIVRCPNCRWEELVGPAYELNKLKESGARIDGSLYGSLRQRAGDRIMVHGWPYDFGGSFGPQRWDVVVFKVPSDGQTNYIKRLIGKPGETVEIIDGDILITDPKTGATSIARKTPHAQRSLWFPYYDQDYPPRRASAGAAYHPRWVALEQDNGWSGLETRCLRFEGQAGRAGEIQFVTAPGSTNEPGEIADVYGYNGSFGLAKAPSSDLVRLVSLPERTVTDVRLSCEARFESGAADGFIELSATKRSDCFYARLYADGRVTLEHATEDGSQREAWGQAGAVPTEGPVRFALSNVDYCVSVEIDGRPVVQSTPAQYDITPDRARAQSGTRKSARLRIGAENVWVRLAHVLIERDVYYTSDMRIGPDGRPGYGTEGYPIKLGPNDYFVLGDNSPASLDARFSFAQEGGDPVGAHLKAAFAHKEYQPGTVPGDQLIGPAFLVYWPGTDALLPDEALPEKLRVLNQLPGPGRIRWIH
jgi:signal peptidase I